METLAPPSPWFAWLVFSPLIGAVAAFLFPRYGAPLGFSAAVATIGSVIGLLRQVIEFGPQHYDLGGWHTPLGIGLYADGFSAVMLLTTATVGFGVTIYATAYFLRKTEAGRFFWPLWLLLWTAMNALFVAADIFNLYVTLELLSLAAVALVVLSGKADALTGAMRYLLVGLLGSLSYLLGVALLYGAHGTLDLALLGERVAPSPALWAATGLMTAGLAIKSALFPLHFWLPSAHSAAPAPVSAVLSALVVKASFYLLARLWFEVFAIESPAVGPLLGALGVAAILWGSLQALRQTRLKLLIAYSTVAQLGYLFLAFPLTFTAAAVTAWNGATLFIVSHALAKAAIFLAAGNILRSAGHDRIADLGGSQHAAAISWIAFSVAGISIIGLPPTAGFAAKWLLLQASIDNGQWWWTVAILAGGLLAAAYIFRIVALAFAPRDADQPESRLPRRMAWTSFSLAVGAVAIGFATLDILNLLSIGAPFDLPVPEAAL